MGLTDGLNNKFITFIHVINFYYRFSFDNPVKFLLLDREFHFNERLYSSEYISKIEKVVNLTTFSCVG